MKKRDEQNRLIRDCKLGKIDRVITKSVSRFARNTQELLVALRTLKELGVSIFFEEQGIDSDKMNMEMLVTFPGMAAQQESVNISDHLRRSYQMRMESGEFNCNAPAYGFEMVDGKMVVKEDEAAVIRRIFDLYLQGVGKQNIANILNAEGVPRRYGQKKWHHTTVDYVVKNERYMGDALLQKEYTTDTVPFRKSEITEKRPNIMWKTATRPLSAGRYSRQHKGCRNPELPQQRKNTTRFCLVSCVAPTAGAPSADNCCVEPCTGCAVTRLLEPQIAKVDVSEKMPFSTPSA